MESDSAKYYKKISIIIIIIHIHFFLIKKNVTKIYPWIIT